MTTTINLNNVAGFHIFSTFASIDLTGLSACFLFVQTDETNGNEPTLYLYDGTNIQWVITQTI
jgi:hypothetical protein